MYSGAREGVLRQAIAFPEKIGQVTNKLAYLTKSYITAVKCLVAKAPGNTLVSFFNNNYQT